MATRWRTQVYFILQAQTILNTPIPVEVGKRAFGALAALENFKLFVYFEIPRHMQEAI